MKPAHRRLIAVLAAAGAACDLASAQSLRTVALTGTDGVRGPGLGQGVTFSTFAFGNGLGGPSINTRGSVAFAGKLAGVGVNSSNDAGIWAWRGGGVQPVARRGSPVETMLGAGTPSGGGGGLLFNSFYTCPLICDSNAVSFQASVSGTGAGTSNNDCLFTESIGWPFAVIRERTTDVPESNPPTVFGDPNGNAVPWGGNEWMTSRNGAVALRTFVIDGFGNFNSHFGIWTDAGPTGSPLDHILKHYRGADTWSGTQGSTTFMGAANPRINASGAIVSGRLDTTWGGSLWTTAAKAPDGSSTAGVGPLRPLAIIGQIAPGTSQPFNAFKSYSINANGRVTFSGALPGAPVAPGGIWSDGRFGIFQAVALSGSVAPGTGSATFATTADWMVIDTLIADNNVTAFSGHLESSPFVGAGNDTGVWSNRSLSTGLPANLRLVFREGDPVPAGIGADYEGLTFGEPECLWINAAGCIAFVTTHNDFTRAIWVERPDGSLRPIAKEFTTIDVSGNGTDFRLIKTIEAISSPAASGDGRRTPWSDAATFTFRAVFSDDREGIFVASVSGTPAVPACSTPQVSQDPTGGSPDIGASITLHTLASGTGPLRMRWLKDGVPLIEGVQTSGAVATGTLRADLTLSNLTASDTGAYTCQITGPCGTITTAPASLTVGAPACPADVTHDGEVDLADFFEFFNCFDQSLPCADVDQSGEVDLGDFFEFFNHFDVGC